MAKESDRDKGFAEGVAWAIAFLERSHGETSLAESMLDESGVSKNSFRRACDPYDYAIVRRFFDRNERWERDMEAIRHAKDQL